MTVQPFALGEAAGLPANPIPNPKTALGQEALALYRAAQAATARIRDCRDAEADAACVVATARAGLQGEVERRDREGQNVEDEVELGCELQARKLPADGDLHNRWRAAALDTQREAVQAWVYFVRRHVGELFEGELEADAQRVSEELIAARNQAHRAEDAYQDVRERVCGLTNIVVVGPDPQTAASLGIRSRDDIALEWALAPDPEPPLPAREVYAPRRVRLAVANDEHETGTEGVTCDPSSFDVVDGVSSGMLITRRQVLRGRSLSSRSAG
jgi:hypothetical protein